LSESFSNSLLSSLSRRDLDLLGPLTALELPRRMVLEAPNRQIATVYFPGSGMASIVLRGGGDREAEVGSFGYEGMSGLAVVADVGMAPTVTFMQIAGSGHSVPAAAIPSAMEASRSIRGCFSRYSFAMGNQVASTALSNAKNTIDERLARWLLMADDRMTTHDVPLTHEYLALMLGVRRAGVTIAINKLMANDLIAARRGCIHINDRRGLIGLCRGTYLKPGASMPAGDQMCTILPQPGHRCLNRQPKQNRAPLIGGFKRLV
jgi:CRP-like cAMP-binding protein